VDKQERRLARAEEIVRRARRGDIDARRVLGAVAPYTAAQGQGRARLAPASESYAVQGEGGLPETVAVNTPERVRRSRTERLDSMIRRLKDLPPNLLEAKIREVQGEFFRLGMPVTYDDLAAVASQYLNRADHKVTPNIRATRTTESTGRK
jgi:hypothetical protein